VSHDPYREVVLGIQTDDEGVTDPPDGDIAEFFWSNYWVWPCSLPERTGRDDLVASDSDVGIRLVPDSYAEFRSMDCVRHEIAVSLPIIGQITHRILLSRYGGRRFSERELQLMRLIQPHLAELLRAKAQPSSKPELTARQEEVLRLVRAGLTNRQVARRLQISEGTVRKHLENIYATRKVTNRLAAVASLS
jgi:DNA-binding CsgD family transcriptional regulator